MKAMNLCRPLELSRGTVISKLENVLEGPSAAWKKRVKECVQAARQDERQLMLKRFMRERKTWENSRREDRKNLQLLQEELKKKDGSISWLKSVINEREDLISKLKEKNAELERHLEDELNSRVENAQTMKKLLGNQPTMYPGLMQFGKLDFDPFREVSMDLLRAHKIREQAEHNKAQDGMSATGTHNTESECSTMEDDVDSKMKISNFMN
mmetsp:Transcript_21782/g.40796  ORF Transcript_21782/g.40796 Transcript_21782/m.40796 type:complete len:211 (-) Transcript_21782:376-1008(-)|eukprot:CAMPEP_0170175104 /NCGR_PEP_ID=MMETSP0040_2-20121228/8235_1 /TAXON_ID=641309 /ORGANISM="Lotharella oceanica, Strain CCMP622" /LENGTH=210 /DNA_ID=CAMNT_0010416981 /DNA_START=116 /DNA_END=748 /DNA_ORIENTATION=+